MVTSSSVLYTLLGCPVLSCAEELCRKRPSGIAASGSTYADAIEKIDKFFFFM